MKTEIEKYSPCVEAVEFRRQFKTFEEAWNHCERGDWMLWIASRVGVDKRKLTLAKGKCAELVIRLMKDERSVNAVKAAIDYGNGKIDEDELKKAAYASAFADAAAYDAASAAAAYAAFAADAASYAAAYYASAAAAYAAAYAAYATAADYAYAVKKETLKKCADICREILTEEVITKI